MPTTTMDSSTATEPRVPWNKGQLIGQKRPVRPKDVWSIRARLEIDDRARDLALFNLAIDSKLRASDLVSLKIEDIQIGGRIRERATIVQQKAGRPVQFELTDSTRKALQPWLAHRGSMTGFLFPASASGEDRRVIYSGDPGLGGARPAARWSAMMSCRYSMPKRVKAVTPSSPTP